MILSLVIHKNVCDSSLVLGCLVNDRFHSLKLGLKFYNDRVNNCTTCNPTAHYCLGKFEFASATRRSEGHLRTNQRDW
jgi:hypothetical protein